MCLSDGRYAEIVPDPMTRTALSGVLGREFWEIASESILAAMEAAVGELVDELDTLVVAHSYRKDSNAAVIEAYRHCKELVAQHLEMT